MPEPRDIDGVLVQWGDRLFYPGNRIVKRTPEAAPLGGSDGAGRRSSASASRPRSCAARRRSWSRSPAADEA